MDTDHQLIVRIKSFLNSTELINSQTAQELYAAYCEINDVAAQRLVECEVLLQKKQKIEAVVLAQQAPNLFELIDAILFPERSLLLILADLYDWKIPDVIRDESVVNLKKAVSEMEDLRPLLTEFRRIARTDQVKNKLHLLREIYRIDKDNPEWKLPLVEVENQYVSQIIAEAQNVIQNKDFVRLEQIYEELKNTEWVVTVPTIVLQKVEKLVLQHKAEEVQKTATVLIDKISAAYAAFDLPALEDAIYCWEEHCKKHQYTPTESEDVQYNEAYEYFSAEKEKQQKHKQQQELLDKVLSMINSSAPLAIVEKVFSQAQAFELEIPAYIVNRVSQYRDDIERERRTAIFIKALKITGTVTVVLLILIGGAIWGIQRKIEDTQAENLHAAIKAGNIVVAETVMKEIEKNYPKLSKRPKITQAKAELQELINKNNKRIAEFNKLSREFNTQKKQWPPDEALITKLKTLNTLALSDDEKNKVRELSDWLDDAIKRRAAEVDDNYIKYLAALKKQKDDLLDVLKKNDFKKAERILSTIEKIYNEIKALKGVSSVLVADSKEMLKSVESLSVMVQSHKDVQNEITSAKERILSTQNLISLEMACQAYEKKFDKNANKIEADSIRISLQDISYLKTILNYQNSQNSPISKQYVKFPFFTDIKFFEKHELNKDRAKKELIVAFDRLHRNIKRQELAYVRLRSGSWFLQIYADPAQIKGTNHVVTMQSVDGITVKLTKRGKDSVNVKMGSDDYPDCTLIYPKTFSLMAFRDSRAGHQILVERFFKDINTISNMDVFACGIRFFNDIRTNEICAPYWKMRFAAYIVGALEKIDLTHDKILVQIKKKLQELQALDNEHGDPLKNTTLAEKIELFFKNYDFSKLNDVLVQNQNIEKLYLAQKQCKLQYLGIALNINGQLKFAINEKLKNTSTEVLCFHGDTGKCLVVGYYDKNNGFVINGEYNGKIAGRLLFTSESAGFYRDILEEIKKNYNGFTSKKVKFPDFWPLNTRGEVKK